MAQQWHSHLLDLDGEVVTKRFRSWDRGEPEREWRTLSLLERAAPGLAPLPLRADLDGEAPTVVMSRVLGTPLRGTLVTPAQIGALAEATTRLYTAAPADVLRHWPPTPSHPSVFAGRVRDWMPPPAALDGDPLVAQAWRSGLRWLDQSSVADPAQPGTVEVLGHGDANLANYLWDDGQVHIVDFEDSGRSDLACELAELVEHGSAWVDSTCDVSAFLGHFDLSPDERSRLRECRRFLALVWLSILGRDDPRSPRNPPGTARRQAERLLALL